LISQRFLLIILLIPGECSLDLWSRQILNLGV